MLPTLGPLELVVIGLVVLVLFGNRLPGVGRALGRCLTEFKQAISGEEPAESK